VIVYFNTTKAKKGILGFVEIDGKLINIGSKTRKDFIMMVLLYDSASHTIGSNDRVPILQLYRQEIYMPSSLEKRAYYQ
jgi:hypothetical protein